MPRTPEELQQLFQQLVAAGRIPPEVLDRMQKGERFVLPIDTDASGWQRLIQDLVPLRAASFRGEAEKILSEGFERYAPRVLENISAALSEWLAHFGVAVTQGLLRELREQIAAMDEPPLVA